jgi:hypothetical protein
MYILALRAETGLSLRGLCDDGRMVRVGRGKYTLW